MIVFDLETDGLLTETLMGKGRKRHKAAGYTTIHCLALRDLKAGTPTELYVGFDECREATRRLLEAPQIAGHNICGYDLHVLEHLYGVHFDLSKAFDTLIATRLAWPDIVRLDSVKKWVTKRLLGSHSLKAWGLRLGVHKGDCDDFSVYTPDMGDYCKGDVATTCAIIKFLKKDRRHYTQQAHKLERSFSYLMARQEINGWPFDVNGAIELYNELSDERDKVHEEIIRQHPGRWHEEIFIPKRDNRTLGYKKGVPFTKRTWVPFNVNSGDQVAELLIERGWEPKVFTETGKPKVDESTISKLVDPISSLLCREQMLTKRIGQLAEGDNGWLLCVDTHDNKIHGSINSQGTITYRCTHSGPNIAQTPANSATYGAECRALWTCEGALVGWDASSLELCCLAHELAPFDNGEYAKTVSMGRKEDGTDPHSVNMRSFGLDERDIAKRAFYALVYGAGSPTFAEIIGTSVKDAKKRIKAFKENTKGFLEFIDTVLTPMIESSGGVFNIDGRFVPIKSQHTALNYRLQTLGAIICKATLVHAVDELESHGYHEGLHYKLLGNIHDETQVDALKVKPEIIGEQLNKSIKYVEYAYGIRCPLSGEYSIGKNWKETH